VHSYTYDRLGLHVKLKGLSSSQEDALTSILDDMVLVDGGTFMMGNTEEMADYLTEQDSLSVNPHEVDLDNYYICKYEVTQKQWSTFLPTEGKCIADGENTAMDMLSWEDAKAFADTLSAITGLQFALPTEAQWEFAARGGTKTHHYIFSGNDDATEVGWTSFEKLTSAHEIGGKRYNELDLYDMTGNVMEWCSDYFDLYSPEKGVNPEGPSKGTNRVLRGGDFRIDNLYDMKTTTRYFDAPFVNRKGAGLRLVINIQK
jgi:formylglycine-generating enzyme required for sulfatase activity